MKFKCEMPSVAMSHAHGDQRLAGHINVFVSDVTTVISIQCLMVYSALITSKFEISLNG